MKNQDMLIKLIIQRIDTKLDDIVQTLNSTILIDTLISTPRTIQILKLLKKLLKLVHKLKAIKG